MKKKITNLYNLIEEETEEWKLSEMEELMVELDELIRAMDDETCDNCGHRPSTGACYQCKQD